MAGAGVERGDLCALTAAGTAPRCRRCGDSRGDVGDQRWGGGRERAEGVGGQTPLYVPPEDEGLCLPPRFTALTEKLVKGPLPREQVLAGQCEVPGVK